MKKKLIFFLSIIIVAIATAITLIIVLTNKKDNIYDIYIDGYGSLYEDNVRLDFGKHKVKNYEKYNYASDRYRIIFDVDSGLDFYNDYIKTHHEYNPELDFKIDRSISYGYIVKNNRIFHYEVFEKTITLDTYHGKVEAFKIGDIDIQSNIIIPGNFSSLIDISEIDIPPYEMDEDDLFLRQSWDKISYENVLKVYSYIEDDLCKIEDNVVYLKGIYYDYDNNKFITDNYYVTLSNYNSIGTLSLI